MILDHARIDILDYYLNIIGIFLNPELIKSSKGCRKRLSPMKSEIK
jgi:hypothetical protein